VPYFARSRMISCTSATSAIVCPLPSECLPFGDYLASGERRVSRGPAGKQRATRWPPERPRSASSRRLCHGRRCDTGGTGREGSQRAESRKRKAESEQEPAAGRQLLLRDERDWAARAERRGARGTNWARGCSIGFAKVRWRRAHLACRVCAARTASCGPARPAPALHPARTARAADRHLAPLPRQISAPSCLATGPLCKRLHSGDTRKSPAAGRRSSLGVIAPRLAQ